MMDYKVLCLFTQILQICYNVDWLFRIILFYGYANISASPNVIYFEGNVITHQHIAIRSTTNSNIPLGHADHMMLTNKY